MQPNTEQTRVETWEDRFNNRFGNYGLYEDCGWGGYQDVMDEVREFIRTELANARVHEKITL